MLAERHVRLFRNGANQALHIPREFEFAGNQAIIRKDGDQLIIEAVKANGLIDLLVTWDALDEEFPDVDSGFLPLDDVVP